MLRPGKKTLTRARVALAHEAINYVRLQSINLEHHHALRLRERRSLRDYDKNQRCEKSGQWSVVGGQ
jgi:hypothetical protein